MRYRFRPWQVLLLLIAVCGAVLGTVAYIRSRSSSTEGLLRRLPSDNAVVLSVDFEALRRARVIDLLAPAAMGQEPEYRAFVNKTGFEYVRDLDSAIVSFHSKGTYLLLRGRFDWQNLSGYAKAQGGTCLNGLCRLPGSTPDRHISYLPIYPNVMALAVSRDESAAFDLSSKRSPARDYPREAIWAVVPASLLKDGTKLPAGTRMFARVLDGAERIVFALGVDGPQMRLRMEVTCRNAESANALAEQLRAITARLREMIARENGVPNPNDLSGLLTSGAFEQKERTVIGYWPIERGFLEALAGGSK